MCGSLHVLTGLGGEGIGLGFFVGTGVLVYWVGWDKVLITPQKITQFSLKYYFSSLPSQKYIYLLTNYIYV